jgi:hypothetical protein
VFIEGAETEEIDNNTHQPLNTHKTNVHQLTAISPIINTVKKPQPALNAHEDLLALATGPLDQVTTHEMVYDIFNADRTMAKEYEEYVEYEEYGEFDAKEHITSHGEVLAPRLWIRGGYNQDEFQSGRLAD